MRPWGDGRYGLTPAQFTRALDTPSVAAVPATAIVLPKVTDRPGTLTLRQIDPAAALAELEDAIFGVGAWRDLGEVFTAPHAEPPQPRRDPRAQCAELVNELPTFECELGLEAYEDPNTISALIDGAL